jgi:hypothetical protein
MAPRRPDDADPLSIVAEVPQRLRRQWEDCANTTDLKTSDWRPTTIGRIEQRLCWIGSMPGPDPRVPSASAGAGVEQGHGSSPMPGRTSAARQSTAWAFDRVAEDGDAP